MTHVTKDNIFHDLGFDREEAEELAMRVYLMAELRKFIKKHKMTQAQAKLEMAALGLSWVETADYLPQQHVLVFQKP